MIRPWTAIVVVALLFGCTASATAAGPQDGIIPLGEYSTPKARSLAEAHKAELARLAEHVYWCLPWLGVVKNGIGFRQPKDVTARRPVPVGLGHRSTRPTTVVRGDVRDRRVSAMFSRYGVDCSGGSRR